MFRGKSCKQKALDLVEDTYGAVTGNPVALARLIRKIKNGPAIIRDLMFVNSLKEFLNAVCVDEKTRLQLAARISEDDDAKRVLIKYIDEAEGKMKIQYLANATRSYLAEYIDRDTFFRICFAINHTLGMDLRYLAEKIKPYNSEEQENIPANESMIAMASTGMTYQSIVGENLCYTFTPFARDVDKYAVSFGRDDKYPNLIDVQDNQTT